MRLKIHRYRQQELVFFLFFYLLVFQNPLTQYVSPVFLYADEVFALLGIVFVAWLGFHPVKKLIIRKSTLRMAALLLIFGACGLTANLLYRYQRADLTLKDLYVNFKFFLSVASGFYLLRYARPEEKLVLRHTKICTVILFSLLVLDLLLDVFPHSGYRYGIKIRNLIFGHVTYLAGTCAFLLAVFLFYYEKRNLKYMAMALLVLISTVRSKALASAAACVVLLYFIVVKKQRIKLWHMLLIGALGIYIAWDQISFYYIELSGRSARSVLTRTSFEIMKDYFPIGTGFGTYGSDVAGQSYSPVYVEYGFTKVHELQKETGFFSDTFWPIIIGQTGFAGTVCYLAVLLELFLKTIRVRAAGCGAYGAVLFVFVFLFISSTSEPTFNNAVSIPLAMLLGWALEMADEAGGAAA